MWTFNSYNPNAARVKTILDGGCLYTGGFNLGDHGVLELKNGANLYANGDFNCSTWGDVTLADDSWMSCNQYYFGGGTTVIRDSTLWTRSNDLIGNNKTGGHIRFEGTHPIWWHNNADGTFRSNLDNANVQIDFLVPEGRNAKDAEWKYTTEKPADGWEKPGFDDRAWKTGVGGFGTKGTPGAKIGTTWNTSDIWLRRHVKLAAAPKAEDGLLLSLHHDEDTEVFFNGVRAGAFPGYTSSYEQFPVPAAAKAALKAGDNVLASVTHQTMGGQYVDWGVAKASAGDAFNLATFNIRCPADTEDNAWSNRLPRVVQVIRKHAFDIFGVQEATPMQRKNLDAALPDFARVGLGRGTNDTGEAMCIYYRKNRFECLATDTFWLSETPREPGSKGWNAACPRTCTWGLFRDKKTGLSFRYFNTHLDHVSPAARVAGMKILLAEMARVAQGETVMLTGDLNDSFERIPPEEQKRLLKGNGPQISSEVTFEHPIANASQTLYDTLFRTEKPHEGTLKTFHAYQPTHHCRIDYVFATGNVRVLRHVTCNDRPDGKYPSDHEAVTATISIK